MDRNQPVLVPGWLKSSSGSVSNGNQQSVLASLHSDDRPVSSHGQNKSSLSGSDRDTHHSPVQGRATSAYFCQNSINNGSVWLRSTGSFGRNQRDRDWDTSVDYHDNDPLVLGSHRRHEHSDPLGNFLPSKFDKEKLRRSQSMVTGKHDEAWSKKLAGDLTSTNKNENNTNSVSSLLDRVNTAPAHDASFAQDFPALAADERQGGASRVSSPGLSTTLQTGCDSWRSSLAEVPVVTGSSSMCSVSPSRAVSAMPATAVPSITGLSMAEALVQLPSRARTPPPVTAGTQRFEELAIRQSKLIPMTPAPKTLAAGPSEKSKLKFGQQHPSGHFVNSRVPVRSDNSKVSNESRLKVLKPLREFNGKESLSPTNRSKGMNSQSGTTAVPTGSSSAQGLGNGANQVRAGHNHFMHMPTAEKKLLSQVKSKNDFFNDIKKNFSTSPTSFMSDSRPTPMPPASNKSSESASEVGAFSGAEHVGDSSSTEISVPSLTSDNIVNVVAPCNAYNGSHKFSDVEEDPICDVTPTPDEEEAKFLRSLGWNEDAGEDVGLTEEEISAFYEKYNKGNPASSLTSPRTRFT